MKQQVVLIFGSLLLLSCISACRQTWHVAEVKVEQYNLKVMPSDSTINHLVAPYREKLNTEMNVVVGTCVTTLEKALPEGGLNNFVGDLLYERVTHYYGPIDFAVANYGGLRISSIGAGPVTLGRLYELMPFDNQAVVLKMKGKLVQKFFDHIAGRGGWPISKQVRFRIKNNQAIAIKINGEPLDKKRTYIVALPDYIANGGDNCDFLQAVERTDLNKLVRDLIIEYVEMKTKAGEEIEADLDGRVSIRND